jgi:D-beta-D-heptose 7-phosphate kinase/D-beta-D-heptose 1-phosphate adenosyltransferase
MIKLAPENVQARLAAMPNKRIAVLGDYMLDRYFWGAVTRISPEAPVPIVEIERETEQLGGAANVAHNLASLGLEAYPLGVVGEDGSGARLAGLMREKGFRTEGIFIDPARPTTIKTRVIAHDQHVVRTDRESRANLPGNLQEAVLHYLEELLPSLHGLIIEDYNKGVVVQPLLARVIALAQRHACPIMVDPKFHHFLDYRNVSVFKPNRKETETVLGMKLQTPEEVQRAGERLLQKLEAENVLITLGAEGMALFEKSGPVHRIPTRAQRVHDVSGAGDTVIATLAAAMAAGAGIVEAAALANYAAGVVVGEVGAVPIDKQKLLAAVAEHQQE